MHKLGKWVALLLAYVFLALAIIGIVLPGIPTVPFLLLAAWFAAKGSKRLHAWLYAHPQFGQMLIDWEQHRAVARKHKILAAVFMAISWAVMYWQTANHWLAIGTALLFISVIGFLASLPEPMRDNVQGAD